MLPPDPPAAGGGDVRRPPQVLQQLIYLITLPTLRKGSFLVAGEGLELLHGLLESAGGDLRLGRRVLRGRERQCDLVAGLER